MPDLSEDPHDPEEDGPEARLYRQDADQEAKWAAVTRWQVDHFLSRLEPRDARRELIPFRLYRLWYIPLRRRWRG